MLINQKEHTQMCFFADMSDSQGKQGIIMKIALAALAALIATPAIADPVRVKGHVRKDGTYVAPHVRTSPDSSKTNNWGSEPNVNPYTGKEGKVDPYAPKPLPKPKRY